MASINIGWDETAPADSRNAGLGAGDIRSIQSNLRGALDAEHHYPSSGGSAGAHRLGSARAYVGTASAVSSADTDGRLMFTSDSSNLYVVNSATTVLAGGRYALHCPSNYTFGNSSRITSKVTQHWHIEFGGHSLATVGSLSYLTFTATFTNPPILVITPASSVTTFNVIPVIANNGDAAVAQIVTYITTSGASGAAPVGSYVNYMAAGFVANG